jgi:hypothetical protein
MATNYIARGEPTVVSASTTSTATVQTTAGFASFSIDNAAGGNVIQVSVFPTSSTSSGNIVVLPGTTKVVAPLNPPLAPTSLTILTTALTGTSTVYITPIVSQQG